MPYPRPPLQSIRMSQDPLSELFSDHREETTATHVLVVDDDEGVREFLAFELGQVFQVDAVASGEECLEFLAADGRPTPDVITLDLMLPKRDGYKVLQTIRDEPKYLDVEVVVISGLGQGDSTTKAFDLGAADYVTKPVNVEELVRRIDRLVA